MDEYGAFQALASHAMVASSALHLENVTTSDTGEVTGMPPVDEFTGLTGSPHVRRKEAVRSPCTSIHLQRSPAKDSFFVSQPPTNSQPFVGQQQKGNAGCASPVPCPPPDTQTMPRPPRRSDQSRRSERAYARGGNGRRSVINTKGPVARGSIAGTVLDSEWEWEAQDEMDDLDWDGTGRRSSGKTRTGSWTVALIVVPFLVSLFFVIGGVLYLVYGSDQMIKNLQIWRLCFFLAGLPLVWWTGKFVMVAVVWGVEKSMFRVQNALYYAYAVRTPLANVIRAVLALGLWALSMMAWTEDQDQGVKNAVLVILKVWACVTLFMIANLLKTFLAKVIGSKFNKDSHQKKIQDSLVKEYYLHMLLQPRNRSDGAMDDLSNTGAGNNKVAISSTNVSTIQAAAEGVADIGGAIAASFREATTSIYQRSLSMVKSRDRANGLSTVSEEPLTTSSSAQAARHVSSTPDVEAQAAQRPPSSTSFPYAHDTAEYPTLPTLSRQASSISRAGMMRHGSLQPRIDAARRASTVFPVIEALAAGQRNGEHGQRGLNATQLARMEAYIRRNALQVTFKDELNLTSRQEEVTTAAEAKKLAFYLFWNVKSDLERAYIEVDDLADFLTPEEAEEAFAMLDDDDNGRVSLQECMDAVLKIFEARCDLALSLKDTRSVVGKLETVLAVVCHIAFVFLYLIVFQVDVLKTYLAMSSLVLAFSFIFQNSIRTMYENVVFLFIVHPFDVGDLLQFGDELLRVDQIDLHYTIFLAPNGARTWHPNQKIMATPFSNLSASGDRGEAIKVPIDMDTPAGALDEVRAAAEALVAANPSEFAEGVSVNLRDAAAPLKVTLMVGFKYAHNGSDLARTSRARTMMHTSVCEALTRFGVKWSGPSSRFDREDARPWGEDDVTAVVAGRTPNLVPAQKPTTGETKKMA